MLLPRDVRIPRSQISEEQAPSNDSIPSAWWERQSVYDCLQVWLGSGGGSSMAQPSSGTDWARGRSDAGPLTQSVDEGPARRGVRTLREEG